MTKSYLIRISEGTIMNHEIVWKKIIMIRKNKSFMREILLDIHVE